MEVRRLIVETHTVVAVYVWGDLSFDCYGPDGVHLLHHLPRCAPYFLVCFLVDVTSLLSRCCRKPLNSASSASSSASKVTKPLTRQVPNTSIPNEPNCTSSNDRQLSRPQQLR